MVDLRGTINIERERERERERENGCTTEGELELFIIPDVNYWFYHQYCYSGNNEILKKQVY